MPAERVPLPHNFVDMISSTVYTPENMARAADYVRSRGADPTQFRLPWAMVNSDKAPWGFVRQWGRHEVSYVDRLYIPIPDMRYDPKLVGNHVLMGFDIRYCGESRMQNKYTKLKRDEKAPMLYNLHEAIGTTERPQTWAVWVESALDAEQVRACRIPVVGALSAIGSVDFAAMMHGLFERNYIMYDNDDAGQKGTKRLLEAAAYGGPEVARSFQQLTYMGKDATDSVNSFGLEYLRSTILSQVNA